jgi:zinc protease
MINSKPPSDKRPFLDEKKHGAFEFEEESGGIEAYRLKANDLKVLILKEAAAPVVTFMVTYHVGSRNESLGLTGATHFLEHLMFKGTERFNKITGTSVFNVLQRVGAEVNATTWFDRTNYYELLPKEHLALAIEIEADRMRGARIAPDDLESERTVILNELDRGENDPTQKLYHAVWSSAFTAHPYHHPTIGWRSDVENVTEEGLRHFYNTFYWPNNATISIIGDLDRSEVFDLVAHHFGQIPRAPTAIPDVHTSEPIQQGERRVMVKQSGQLGAVMMAYKSPPGLDSDTDALDVLSVVLTSGKSSRLYRRLTDNGLTTHLFSGSSRLRDPGLFYLFAMLAPDRTHDEVESAILDVVEAFKSEQISGDELQRAKNQRKAQEAFGRDGPFAVASQLNEAIAAGDWKLYTGMRERIERITAEDVQRVAQKYLVDDFLTVGNYVPT